LSRAPGVSGGATYRDAGVDIDAGEAAVDRIRALVAGTARPGVLGGIGGFAGCFSLAQAGRSGPVLVSSADGVGTKLLVARRAGRYDTIGLDLVAMLVDDLVCTGAEPLFLLDYIAVGRLDPDRIAEVVSGIAEGCRRVGCALLGGETAEHPGAMDAGDMDVAGFAVGVVEESEMLGPDRVREGDVLVGLESPGLRSNGYSLARQVLLERPGAALDDPAWPGSETTVAEELLRPSELYAPAVRRVATTLPGALHAAAHITGGGLLGNIPRALPDGLGALVQRTAWEVPPIFTEIARRGQVAEMEMARVFNLGIGMVLVVEEDTVEEVMVAASGTGAAARVIGEVQSGIHGVELV